VSTVLASHERTAVEHDRTAFNLAVWSKLSSDPEIARLPYRLETDKHGQVIMSPPPAPSHGYKQSNIVHLLMRKISHGVVITECPVSTRMGVKLVDVAWCSDEAWALGKSQACLTRAPEICVEVLSPSNTRSEIEEKRALYFEAGAREVLLCCENSGMRFFTAGGETQTSGLCPEFPRQIA